MGVYLGSLLTKINAFEIITESPRPVEIIQGTISGTYINSEVSSLRTKAFAYCSLLTDINLLNCEFIDESAFYACTSLVTVNLPNCEFVGEDAFRNCTLLTTVNIPNCSIISLYAFTQCNNLLSVYLTSVSSVPLLNYGVFDLTPIAGYTQTGTFGSVYVPSSLYNSFITATNWSYISTRIVGV